MNTKKYLYWIVKTLNEFSLIIVNYRNGEYISISNLTYFALIPLHADIDLYIQTIGDILSSVGWT